MGRTLLIALGIAGTLYVTATVMLFGMQRRLIYPASRAVFVSKEDPSPFEEARLATTDGLRLRALYRPAVGMRPVIVFFHGNGDDLGGAIMATRALATEGYGLLLPEYRGYGGNSGSPSEEGLYRDGAAAMRWLADRGVRSANVVIVGNSLGSGVATELATHHEVAGLVLISGFTSLADVAASQMRFFPARLLIRDRYENAAKLALVAAPTLILHGGRDGLIAPAHGAKLVKVARRGEFELVPEAGHELAYLPRSQSAILRWLQSIGR
ncbi:alpha/beta hydrolase [uncultured Sphingomonas sp.]|uniref:alpha/beta hydrolase n=1 Tax=uncultured Sphingomonas sp. TaxID=158754 RepID=UPI0035CB73DA